jgi:hypothetical protein
MPYRFRKPYLIVNGQRVSIPNAPPQNLPWCDRCDTLAANAAPLYAELAPDKWWKWFSFPRFACEDKAFMGCEKHRVEAEIRFLDGRTERFTKLPPTRGQMWTKPDHIIPAIVFAVIFAVLVDLLSKWLAEVL